MPSVGPSVTVAMIRSPPVEGRVAEVPATVVREPVSDVVAAGQSPSMVVADPRAQRTSPRQPLVYPTVGATTSSKVVGQQPPRLTVRAGKSR